MRRFAILFTLMLVAASPVLAAGLMRPKDSALPELQIQDHQVRVLINNGFAITEIDQTFYNPSDVDLDAIYTFPLPRDSALSELSLWIDGVEVIGEVVEKERARKIAAAEKEAGRETAVAEQREYYAYDVLVSPVRAQDTTRVRLVYLQPIEIDGGVGRYVYPLEEGRIDEEMHAFWDRRPAIHGKFSFECNVRSSYPLDDVRAKGFAKSVVTRDSSDTWTIWVDGAEEGVSLDEDIVVYYRLAENQPARVDLLPYRAVNGPGSFMLVITPGADLQPITEGVDWSIVLDVSGSMADKLATAGDALARSLDVLRTQDRFRVFLFAQNARELTQGWTPVNDATVETATRALTSLETAGGTNLFSGVKAGLRGMEADRTSALILISDGGANIGPTRYNKFRELLDTQDVRVFTFVMGQGANRPLLGRMAEESGGFSMDVSNQDDLYGRIVQAKDKLAREALHGVQVDLDGVRVADRSPERFSSAYFGQQIVMFGRYFEPGEATLRLSARISGEDKSWETRIELPEHDERYPEIERLWALARIDELQKKIDDADGDSELEQAIVDLGTGYSIVSEYTSMLVVREERFDELGIDRRNRRRTETERGAREARAQNLVQPTRADRSQPMFGGAPAHSSGGGGGGGGGMGAAGPAFVGLLAGLYGLRRWVGRRGRRS